MTKKKTSYTISVGGITMKKLSVILTIAIFIAMSFALSACNSVTKIDDFREKLETAESLEFSVSMEALDMEYSYTMKIDGNKAYYVDSESEPYYTELKDDGYLYTYTKTADGWVSDYGRYVPETSEDADPLAEYAVEELFNGKNYEYSREYKVYMARSDADISFDGITLKKVELTLTGGNCNISASTTVEGVPAKVKMVFKNINSTVVSIPKSNIQYP